MEAYTIETLGNHVLASDEERYLFSKDGGKTFPFSLWRGATCGERLAKHWASWTEGPRNSQTPSEPNQKKSPPVRTHRAPRSYYAFEWLGYYGESITVEHREYSNGRPRTTFRAYGQLYRFANKAMRDSWVSSNSIRREVCSGNNFPEGWSNRKMAEDFC